jgi:transcription elongation factor GreA
LRGINQRILEIEDILKRAEIIRPDENKEIVGLGHLVTIEINSKIADQIVGNQVASPRKTYQILGSAETNPARGIISHNSPLGAALLGRRVGDIIEVGVAGKITAYKIVKIK